MATVLQCFALLCACYIDTTLSHFELKNVAYSKKVSLSSGYQGNTYPGSLAVNGIFSDFAHTSTEKSPWMRVDLGARYRIHEIEVFARSDGYGKLYIVGYFSLQKSLFTWYWYNILFLKRHKSNCMLTGFLYASMIINDIILYAWKDFYICSRNINTITWHQYRN